MSLQGKSEAGNTMIGTAASGKVMTGNVQECPVMEKELQNDTSGNEKEGSGAN